MDKINFLAADAFPVTSETLSLMQDMTALAAKLSALGGDNYILEGCIENNNTVSAGMIVIAGEILPFAGGEKKDRIKITETRKTVDAFGVTYPEAYIYRIAEFSDTGDLAWADFKQILTNRELQQKIEAIKGDAPGTVKMWAGRVDKIESDYRLCNGDILVKAEYPELFENLGTSFGGDGVNSFALPDLRGRFIVGYDNSKNDYKAISKDNIGGDETVTLTEDHIPEHDHANDNIFNKLSAKASDVDVVSTPGSLDAITPEKEYNVGSMNQTLWNAATIKKFGKGKAHENRPPYFVLAYIIKVK